MKEDSHYKKRLAKNMFYSFEAPYLVFSDMASREVCKRFGITHAHLRFMAAARLFMGLNSLVRTDQLVKILKCNKVYVSKTLKFLTENDFLIKATPDVIEKRKGRKVKNKKSYYVLGSRGVGLINSFTKITQEMIREFDEDREKGKYKFIKINKKGEAE